jgi:hypothetical protein
MLSGTLSPTLYSRTSACLDNGKHQIWYSPTPSRLPRHICEPRESPEEIAAATLRQARASHLGRKIFGLFTLRREQQGERIQTTPFDDNRIAIDFSHLNAGDGVVFSVLHTGRSDSDLQIRGELIGFGPPQPYKYDPPGTTGCIVVLISCLESAIARFLDGMLSPSSRPAMLSATKHNAILDGCVKCILHGIIPP